MVQGPLSINFEALWQEGMLDWQGNMPKRMVDDTLEEAFWQQAIEKKKDRQVDPYAEIIFHEIKRHINPTDSVIEIGPGWGNYTFSLADYARQLTCVDSSESILAYLKQNMSRDKDVRFVHAKWEEAQLEQHDVIVGVNCFYRIYHMLDTLKKMSALAKKRVIIGVTTGPIQPHYNILHDKFGYEVKYPRRDYIEILNMLYQLGIFANCSIIPLERVYHYETLEQLIAAQSKKILCKHYEVSHVEESLRPFVEQTEQGYAYSTPFYAAIISWDPSNFQEVFT